MLGTLATVLPILALQVGLEHAASRSRVLPPILLSIEDADSASLLEALGVPSGAGRRHTRERLIVLSANGQVIRTIEGADRHVILPADLDRLLAIPGSGLTLLHNHPEGNGLSVDDLSQLEKPGVRAVIAIGHDGSMYSAARGTRFITNDLMVSEDTVYAAARARAERVLRTEQDPALRRAFSVHLHHVLATALDRANILDYQSALGQERLMSFSNSRLFLARVRDAAAHAVGRRAPDG